ncbi:MAG: mechanosensitive ion channel family protein [Xenococcaceae cyanobacterium]
MNSLKFWIIAGSIVVTAWVVFPVQAQIPFLPNWKPQTSSLLNQSSDNPVVFACIRLDGRCLFKIADQKSDISERIGEIEQRLKDIGDTYFKNDIDELKIRKQEVGNLQDIYISVGDRELRLLTVTRWDADIEGVSIDLRADLLIERLQAGLERAKQERQQSFLTRQVGIAFGTGAVMLLTSLAISRWKRRLKQLKDQVADSDSSDSQPISTQLTQRQKWNLREVRYRLFQLIQAGIWAGGTLFILGLFPYTRMIQFLIIGSLQIPFKVGIVGLGTYVVIRLSYALIARFNSVLANNYLLTSVSGRRVRLRISTISVVTRSIVTISSIGVGILVAFSVTGVNITPLLAGAGIIGVALSLAAQNLIKDVINGFCIILEDQYAVGDVIKVGDMTGLVENMNLRITQLRDAEGRLITFPNSEIKVVANLSSNWSRADLNIPVAYQTDVDKSLELIGKVAEEMSQDLIWRKYILEPPQVLGVDNFGERGVIIKVWIKTEPLKQWEVSREFRRRIKVAFDRAGIPIPLPQQQVWFRGSEI